MVRFRGGAPSNMGQGKYWVRRNLDDQRRARGAANRAIREREAQERANERAQKRATKEREKELELEKKLLPLQSHLNKISNEIYTFQRKAAAGEIHDPEDVDEETELFKQLEESRVKYNDHFSSMVEGTTPLSRTALSTHIANTKRMLALLGKVSGNKVKWNAEEKSLTFGTHVLDFSAPPEGVYIEGPDADYASQEPAQEPTQEAPKAASMPQETLVFEPAQEPAQESTASTLGFMILVLSAVWAFFFVVAGFITGWESFSDVLVGSIVLPVLLIIGYGIFGGSR